MKGLILSVHFKPDNPYNSNKL